MLKPLSRHPNPLKPMVPVSTSGSSSSKSSYYIYKRTEREKDRFLARPWSPANPQKASSPLAIHCGKVQPRQCQFGQFEQFGLIIESI